MWDLSVWRHTQHQMTHSVCYCHSICPSLSPALLLTFKRHWKGDSGIHGVRISAFFIEILEGSWAWHCYRFLLFRILTALPVYSWMQSSTASCCARLPRLCTGLFYPTHTNTTSNKMHSQLYTKLTSTHRHMNFTHNLKSIGLLHLNSP